MVLSRNNKGNKEGITVCSKEGYVLGYQLILASCTSESSQILFFRISDYFSDMLVYRCHISSFIGVYHLLDFLIFKCIILKSIVSLRYIDSMILVVL